MRRQRETQPPASDARFVANASTQESLQQFNVPDPTLGEQTWPTEEELAEAEKLDTEKKKLRRLVPRGTSAYQAAWIVDDYGYADDDDDDEQRAG
jgi:pre-rRNA-processing protein TSR1